MGRFYTWLTLNYNSCWLTCQSQCVLRELTCFSLSRLQYMLRGKSRSMSGLFLSFIISVYPSYLSLFLSPSRHKRTQSHIVCSVVTPQPHFRDDCPCVMKQALSGATADYMASCSDQSLCINTLEKKQSMQCNMLMDKLQQCLSDRDKALSAFSV